MTMPVQKQKTKRLSPTVFVQEEEIPTKKTKKKNKNTDS